MPYGCTVVRVDGLTAVLRVEADQPDCEPFYRRADFALALLLGEGDGALAAALGDDVLEDLGAGKVDAAPYVASFDVAVERRGRLRDDLTPVALYTVRVTDRRWLAHLRPGDGHGCYGFCEDGPVVPEDELWEVEAPLPVGSYARGDRVAVHGPPYPSTRCGRGGVVETAVCARAPSFWEGGLLVARVDFDHGPRAWVFAETLRHAPPDTYERAAADPGRFFDDLLALSPLERARGLRWMALRSGGDGMVTAGDLTVGIPGRSVWLFGLLRRLPFPRAASIAAALVAGWVQDPDGATARLGASIAGTELAAGDTAEPYLFEYACPVELALGALTLLCADERARTGSVHLPAPVVALVAELRRDLPATWFGFPADAWRARLAYLAAAATGTVPALPAWVLDGYPPGSGSSDAAELGLDGAYVPPSTLDRFRV